MNNTQLHKTELYNQLLIRDFLVIFTPEKSCTFKKLPSLTKSLYLRKIHLQFNTILYPTGPDRIELNSNKPNYFAQIDLQFNLTLPRQTSPSRTLTKRTGRYHSIPNHELNSFLINLNLQYISTTYHTKLNIAVPDVTSPKPTSQNTTSLDRT